MAEVKQKADDGNSADLSDYQPPAIEEVVPRSELEREAAYAGTIGDSNDFN